MNNFLEFKTTRCMYINMILHTTEDVNHVYIIEI